MQALPFIRSFQAFQVELYAVACFLWVFYSVWEARIVPWFTMVFMERSKRVKLIFFLLCLGNMGIWCVVHHPAILLCIIYPFWGSGGGGCQQFRCWYVDNFLTFIPLNCQQLGLFGVVLHITFSSFQKSYPHFCIALTVVLFVLVRLNFSLRLIKLPAQNAFNT